MKATGDKGVNLVVNNVGGSVFAETIRALAYEGRHATVGYVDGVLKSRDPTSSAATQAPDALRRVQPPAHSGAARGDRARLRRR